jgi:hypothetical protein
MRDPAAGPHQHPGALSDRDVAILDFERDWRSHEGGKDAAIRERFGISSARYYQLLARLLDSPAAAEQDPLLIARLHRRRARRNDRRVGAALGRHQER